MEIIVDTNVFIDSIFHEDENCTELLRREHKNEIKFVMSHEISEELTNTVFQHAKELGCTLDEFQQPFARLSRTFRRAIPSEPKTKTKYCSHWKDEKFIECAIDANVKYIISSDNHLLGIKAEIKNKNNGLIEIITPEDFLKIHDKYRLENKFNIYNKLFKRKSIK